MLVKEAKQIHLHANMFSPEKDVKRTRGLHLSHVINYIEHQEGSREEEDVTGSLSQIGHAYAAGGFMWERVLERVLENDPVQLWEWLFTGVLHDIEYPNVVRPGEQCVDGILMTPDGLNIQDDYLEEWKYTTKSARTPITDRKFRRWTEFQIPSYLHALGLNICRLRVYFARGDYTTGVPIWMEYLLYYGDTELEEIWDMIVRNAHAMRRDGLVNENAT